MSIPIFPAKLSSSKFGFHLMFNSCIFSAYHSVLHVKKWVCLYPTSVLPQESNHCIWICKLQVAFKAHIEHVLPQIGVLAFWIACPLYLSSLEMKLWSLGFNPVFTTCKLCIFGQLTTAKSISFLIWTKEMILTLSNKTSISNTHKLQCNSAT